MLAQPVHPLPFLSRACACLYSSLNPPIATLLFAHAHLLLPLLKSNLDFICQKKKEKEKTNKQTKRNAQSIPLQPNQNPYCISSLYEPAELKSRMGMKQQKFLYDVLDTRFRNTDDYDYINA